MNNLLTSIGHIWQLGLKELRSLWRDRLLLLFVIWAFSGALYTAAKAAPDRLHRAAIAVVDEDQSPLSQRIVTASTGFGLLMSTFTGSQIAAIFGTALATMLPAIQFSGLINPVSSLEGMGALLGKIYPTGPFLIISRGTYSKALGLTDLWTYFIPLLVIIPVLTLASVILLKKQDT